ncbi:hypothetical protein [Tenuibacillus multivorans]|uniref:SPOR domain-containing protein n=1 Tax=Tenuibacillus multivorans TaxID=237069 RepID=A0A1G9ZLA8_9BACI|nr:hypothetical protein [Tenuibacillus multivorans]GEL77450.1 hypothetical protein TMU01_16850 [Tenuibacillus multivorans]SDN22128.1 hypothetical protein SAMN05216498_1750 [Tenuibacillus multivorans]
MDEHKKVRVTMNQQSTNHKKNDLEYFLTPKSSKNSKPSFFRGRSMYGKMVKPVVFAVILGVVFGAGLIYFFSDLTPSAIPVASVDDEENQAEEEGNDGEQSTENPLAFNIPGKTHDVIQFGVFSSAENAREFIQTLLSPHAIPAVVQENNGQFFIISHLIYSESEKNQITEWLESKDLIYMEDFLYKSWSFNPVEAQVSEEEQAWLEQGLDLIEAYQNSDSIDNWVADSLAWIDERPEAYRNNQKLIQAHELLADIQGGLDSQLQNFYTHTTLLNLQLFFSNIA